MIVPQAVRQTRLLEVGSWSGDINWATNDAAHPSLSVHVTSYHVPDP